MCRNISLLTVTTALLLLGATNASARDCERGVEGVLELENLTFTERELASQIYIEFTLTIRNVSDSDIRMVDGTFFLDDVLGREIFNMPIKEDYTAANSEVDIQEFILPSSFGIGRVLDIDATDLITTMCVEAYVTVEGEVIHLSD